jgi:uncharacterized membrane protein YqiK
MATDSPSPEPAGAGAPDENERVRIRFEEIDKQYKEGDDAGTAQVAQARMAKQSAKAAWFAAESLATTAGWQRRAAEAQLHAAESQAKSADALRDAAEEQKQASMFLRDTAKWTKWLAIATFALAVVTFLSWMYQLCMK